MINVEIPRAKDLNSRGIVFGGWTLSQLDIAGSMEAWPVTNGHVTSKVDNVKFIRPILQDEMVYFLGEVTAINQDRGEVQVHIDACIFENNEYIDVAQGDLTFVKVDENGKRVKLADFAEKNLF